MSDTEHRLSMLQADFKILQDSYDNLETSRSDMNRENDHEMKKLKLQCDQLQRDLVNFEDASRESESREILLKEQLKQLESALDQSKSQLAQCEKTLQVLLHLYMHHQLHEVFHLHSLELTQEVGQENNVVSMAFYMCIDHP